MLLIERRQRVVMSGSARDGRVDRDSPRSMAASRTGAARRRYIAQSGCQRPPLTGTTASAFSSARARNSRNAVVRSGRSTATISTLRRHRQCRRDRERTAAGPAVEHDETRCEQDSRRAEWCRSASVRPRAMIRTGRRQREARSCPPNAARGAVAALHMPVQPSIHSISRKMRRNRRCSSPRSIRASRIVAGSTRVLRTGSIRKGS